MAQADALRLFGSGYLQGYLFTRPMPVADLERFFKASLRKNEDLTSPSPR